LSYGILIPVFNEAPLLESALLRLDPGCEVVIVDAGSRDGSQVIARKICKDRSWKFVAADLEQPSVGRTVSAGLKKMSAENALILPCDCAIGRIALDDWIKVIEQGGTCGGFAKSYSPKNPLLGFYAELQNKVRSQWGRHLVWTNVMFFRRGTPIPTTGFLEDVLLSDILRKEKGWRWIEIPVEVSARRYYPNRIWKRILLNLGVLLAFRAGYRNFSKLKRLYSSLA